MSDSLQFSNNIAARGLSLLKKLRRLDGVGIISDGMLVHWDLPMSKEDADALCRRIVDVMEGWGEGRGETAHAQFSFDGGNLLISSAGAVSLIILYNGEDKTELMVRSAEDYLQQYAHAVGGQRAVATRNPAPARIRQEPVTQTNGNHPAAAVVPPKVEEAPVAEEPEPEEQLSDEDAWNEFRVCLERLFSKVLGSAQAQRNIDRELKSMGITRGGYLRRNQFRPFGQRMIERVRDRQVRKLLDAELSSLMSRF